MKHKKSKIFIIISSICLLSLTVLYTYRLIYYYRIENPKEVERLTLNEIITLQKNIVTNNDGLYKENNSYIFKGNNVNNYLFYSGIMWRIINVDNEGNLKLVSDKTLSSLVWGYNTSNYSKSNIIKWTNNLEKQLNKKDDYLIKSKYCVDSIEKNINDTCTKEESYLIGLLSLKEYESAKGSNSYLNNKTYYWTINSSKNNKIWYIDLEGKLSDNSYSGNVYQTYGIRPTITLKNGLKLISGNGSKLTPYKIEDEKKTTLNNTTIGDYISYSGYTFKVVNKDTTKTKVVMDGTLKENNKDSLKPFSNTEINFNTNYDNIGYYLNNDFYNTLKNKDYLEKGHWYTGEYSYQTKYNYSNIFTQKETQYIGLLHIGEIFSNEYTNYYTLTPSNNFDNTVYKVKENGLVYADIFSNPNKVRPSLYLKNTLKITDGNGNKDNPFKISK